MKLEDRSPARSSEADQHRAGHDNTHRSYSHEWHSQASLVSVSSRSPTAFTLVVLGASRLRKPS